MYLDSSGQNDAALAVYGRARDLVEELFRTNPSNARIAHEVPRTLGNFAIALERAGRDNEALAAHNRARELLGVIGEANPSLLSVTRDRAWIDGMSAEILTRAARDAEALPLLERARKARETLVKAGTSLVRDQTQLIRMHKQIAAIHARAGRKLQALASREPAVAIATKLANAGLDDLGIQSELTGAYLDIADLLNTTGTPSEALSWHDKVMAIHRRLAQAELSRWRYNLANSLRLRGITLHQCGRPADAVSDFREAIKLLEGAPGPTAVDIYDLACCESLLSGIASEAGSGLTAADGEAEAVKAIDCLRWAFAAGWKQLDHMRVDTDLDPIRSRRDYQMLILDYGFPTNPFGPAR